eukprot:35889_1
MLYAIGQIDTGSAELFINLTKPGMVGMVLFAIISIDLNKLNDERDFIKIHEYYSVENYRFDSTLSTGVRMDRVTDICLTSNGSHLFLITEKIWIYNIENALKYNETFLTRNSYNNLWYETTEKIPYYLKGAGCSMNWNNSNLYIFGGWIHDVNDEILCNGTDSVITCVCIDMNRMCIFHDIKDASKDVCVDMNIPQGTTINNKIWKYDTRKNKLSFLKNITWDINPRYLIQTLLAP